MDSKDKDKSQGSSSNVGITTDAERDGKRTLFGHPLPTQLQTAESTNLFAGSTNVGSVVEKHTLFGHPLPTQLQSSAPQSTSLFAGSTNVGSVVGLRASTDDPSWKVFSSEKVMKVKSKLEPEIVINKPKISEPKMPAKVDDEQVAKVAVPKVAVDARKAELEEIVKQMREARQLDLCFLVDVTGSMRPHIDGVKKSIRNIVEKLTSARSAAVTQSIVTKVRLAFVGYRDFGDEVRFEVLDFTPSVGDFYNFCDKIVATGGADSPEDVFGGLERSIALNWTKDSSSRMLFHIADAPCHGREFQSLGVDDRFPNGDPSGRTIEQLFGQIMEKGLQYYFGRITNRTDTMIKKFADVYDREILVCDVKDTQQIFSTVLSSASTAVGRVAHAGTGLSGLFGANFSAQQTSVGFSRHGQANFGAPNYTKTDTSNFGAPASLFAQAAPVQFQSLSSAMAAPAFTGLGHTTSTQFQQQQHQEPFCGSRLGQQQSCVQPTSAFASGAVQLQAATGALFSSARPERQVQAITFDAVQPDWNSVPVTKCTVLSYELPVSVDDVISGISLQRKALDKVELKAAKNPFARVDECAAFYGRYLPSEDADPIDMVVKKFVDDLNRPIIAPDRYEEEVKLRTIATFLATKFNEEFFAKFGFGHIVKFMEAYVLSADNDGTSEHMMCEKRFVEGSEYLRFTNNTDYVMLEVTANLKRVDMNVVRELCAFSHWTFQASRGYLMVVDLQGVVLSAIDGKPPCVVLTDPSIHCTDAMRFGRANYGEVGMKSFFSAHECNEICKKMGLTVPDAMRAGLPM